MDMHPIQAHIMKQLTGAKELRYAHMKPAGVEGNKFSYHLKILQENGYVKRSGDGYMLTTKGVRYSTQVGFKEFFSLIHPKIVTYMVCKHTSGAYLLYERNRLPFLNRIGFPYGKIRIGETIQEAAEREFKKHTNISATLTQKGIIYLTMVDEIGDVITHILAHVFFGTTNEKVYSDPVYGTLLWMKEDEFLTHPHIMPGVKEVLEIAKNKKSGLEFKECEFQEI